MVRHVRGQCRRGWTIADLAVAVTCLLVAGTLLVSLAGATRNINQAQVCASNLGQMFAGVTAYVNQYNSYPPHAPYPTYMASETINGVTTLGWDPNIGFIMTHGLGLTPPATDTAGHFKWYGTLFADLPDVCKCPAMSPALLDPANPEISGPTALETVLYQYALSYQTSGTVRSATTVVKAPSGSVPGVGGRNPTVPDPTSFMTAQPCDNSQSGAPYVWVGHHTGSVDSTTWDNQYSCWIQAINPSEVDQPGRVYYIADGRDYRPTPESFPPAGKYSGWGSGYGNKLFLGARHYGYSNVMYLDGCVLREQQTHVPQWNMDYDSASGQARSGLWRAGTFNVDIRLANIHGQMPIMPVFMVKGWEYFFDANGMRAK
jgi:prepilin-type processing-associated H-X9-DG protein